MGEPAVQSAAPKAPPKGKAKQPWDQQPGENDLWYSRFLRFAALGPTRSVSLLTRGRRNAYPVPAHWASQASQRGWRLRATAFDLAVGPELEKTKHPLLDAFNERLRGLSGAIGPMGETDAYSTWLFEAGYQPPEPDNDDWEEEPITAPSLAVAEPEPQQPPKLADDPAPPPAAKVRKVARADTGEELVVIPQPAYLNRPKD